MTYPYKNRGNENKESNEEKTYKSAQKQRIGYSLTLFSLLLITFLKSLLPYFSKCPFCKSGEIREIFCTFEVRDIPIYGAIQNKSKEKGRHTGASPEASSMLRMGMSRSDLPLFSNQKFKVMRDIKAGQNLSNPSHADVAKQFFSMWGSPEHIDEMLWSILVASFNSKDTNDLSPLDRANRLCLYRDVTKLIHSLKQAES